MQKQTAVWFKNKWLLQAVSLSYQSFTVQNWRTASCVCLRCVLWADSRPVSHDWKMTCMNWAVCVLVTRSGCFISCPGWCVTHLRCFQFSAFCPPVLWESVPPRTHITHHTYIHEYTHVHAYICQITHKLDLKHYVQPLTYNYKNMCAVISSVTVQINDRCIEFLCVSVFILSLISSHKCQEESNRTQLFVVYLSDHLQTRIHLLTLLRVRMHCSDPEIRCL